MTDQTASQAIVFVLECRTVAHGPLAEVIDVLPELVLLVSNPEKARAFMRVNTEWNDDSEAWCWCLCQAIVDDFDPSDPHPVFYSRRGDWYATFNEALNASRPALGSDDAGEGE